MALSSTIIWEVENGGSDTANSGGFDPASGGTATDLTIVSASGTSAAPVVSSVSYTFVAGDVGAWVFVKSGTNWTPGWYKITSVASGQATLNATIGQAVLNSTGNQVVGPNTAQGCCTLATPGGNATWAIDRSQQTTPYLTINNSTVTCTSATATPAILTFASGYTATPADVGNVVYISAGTNTNTGFYVITAQTSTTWTLAGVSNVNNGVGAGSAITGFMGGCFASPGEAINTAMVAGNSVWVKYSATSYTTGVALSVVGKEYQPTIFAGYNLIRGDLTNIYNYANFPTIQATAGSFAIFSSAATSYSRIRNFILDSNSQTTSSGYASNGNDYNIIENCKAINFTTSGFSNASGNVLIRRCLATSSAGATAIGFTNTGSGSVCEDCVANMTGSGGTGFHGGAGSAFFLRCIAYGCLGANGNGFDITSTFGSKYYNCISYNNAQNGFFFNGVNTADIVAIYNCVAAKNSGVGIKVSTTTTWTDLACDYNALFSNTTSHYSGVVTPYNSGQTAGAHDIILTVDPFTNGTIGDFSLNNTTGGGAALRATGYPGIIAGGTTTGYTDIGAIQHKNPATSASTRGMLSGGRM